MIIYMDSLWYMNVENRTTQYQVIVKNVTPYPKNALSQLSRGVFL